MKIDGVVAAVAEQYDWNEVFAVLAGTDTMRYNLSKNTKVIIEM